MTITVRECRLEEIDALINISKKTFDETFRADNTAENKAHYLKTAFTVEKMKKELHNPQSKFFFAMSEDEVAGYLKVNVGAAQSEEMGDDQLEVENLYRPKLSKAWNP